MKNWHIFIDLGENNYKEICQICNLTPCDVDVKYGSRSIDGKSLIGLAAIAWHEVELIPLTDDESIKENFYNKVAAVGAYIKERV